MLFGELVEINPGPELLALKRVLDGLAVMMFLDPVCVGEGSITVYIPLDCSNLSRMFYFSIYVNFQHLGTQFIVNL